METQIWRTYKEQGVMVFGMDVDETQSVVEDFINEFQITFPVLLATGNLQNQYELARNTVAPYPRDFIMVCQRMAVFSSEKEYPTMDGRLFAGRVGQGWWG